jgi:hypothetical protein
VHTFFFKYRDGLIRKFAGLFADGSDKDENETEAERKEREMAERKEAKWNWYAFFYMAAKGCPVKLKEVLQLNFIYLLNFKSYELENKKNKEYYDYGRYNISEWSQQK